VGDKKLKFLDQQLPDADPAETQEWLDSIQAVIKDKGASRTRALVRMLLQQARSLNVEIPELVQTPDINTIPPNSLTGSVATSPRMPHRRRSMMSGSITFFGERTTTPQAIRFFFKATHLPEYMPGHFWRDGSANRRWMGSGANRSRGRGFHPIRIRD
jgi:hypothetical protein